MGEERQKWGTRVAFILAAVGSAVGLGNVWRFPYIAYDNGGGAFFIPYFAALIAAGIPIMILEYGLGILYQQGAPGALEQISSKFKWVGWLALLVGLTVSFYYVPVMGWSWEYLVASQSMEWTKPTRKGTVFVIPYAKYKTKAEKRRLKSKLQRSDRSGVRLIEEGSFDQVKKELQSLWGGENVKFYRASNKSSTRDQSNGTSELRSFVKTVYEKKNGHDKPDQIRVLFVPYDHQSSPDAEKNIQRWAQTFYKQKFAELRNENREYMWYTGLDPARKVEFLKVKENAAHYFSREVLGGFHPGQWKTENLISRAITKIKEKGERFSPSDLKPSYYITDTSFSKAEQQSGVQITNDLLDAVKEGGSDWRSKLETFFRKGAGIYLGRFDQNDNRTYSASERQQIVSYLRTVRDSGTIQVHVLDTLTPSFARVFAGLRHNHQKMKMAETDEQEEQFQSKKNTYLASLRSGLIELQNRRQQINGGKPAGQRMSETNTSLIIWSLVTWFIIFLIIFKGVDTVGKVVLWTVPIPLLLLGALIVRGLLMNGMMNGLELYLQPTWEQVAKPGVWLAAFSQIFFTLSLGFGIMIAYASYLPEDSDISNNSFITSFANCATSFYAGFAVFSVLGALAWQLNVPVENVMTSGPGLVFKVYPVALSELPGGSFWGILFFLSLLTLGIDSAFSIVEAVVTGLNDTLEQVPRVTIVTLICGFGALVSVFIFCRRSGLMWLDIVDHFISGSFGLPLVGLLECVAVGLFFNTDAFREKINEQSEIQIGRWWNVLIQILIPAGLIYLLWDAVIQLAPSEYGNYHKIVENSVVYGGWVYFAVLLFLAFLLGGSLTGVIWVVTGAVLILLLTTLFGLSGSMSIMLTVALLLLFGGFFTCLTYVRPAFPEQGAADDQHDAEEDHDTSGSTTTEKADREQKTDEVEKKRSTENGEEVNTGDEEAKDEDQDDDNDHENDEDEEFVDW